MTMLDPQLSDLAAASGENLPRSVLEAELLALRTSLAQANARAGVLREALEKSVFALGLVRDALLYVKRGAFGFQDFWPERAAQVTAALESANAALAATSAPDDGMVRISLDSWNAISKIAGDLEGMALLFREVESSPHQSTFLQTICDQLRAALSPQGRT